MIISTGNHHDHHGRYQDWLAALPLLSPHHWNITCWLSPLAIKIPIIIIIIIVTIPSPSTHTGWHCAPRKKQKGQFLSTFVRSPQFSREKKCGLTLSPRFICFHNNSPFPCCFRPKSQCHRLLFPLHICLLVILWVWVDKPAQCSSHHQIVVWILIWFDKRYQFTNSETAMLSRFGLGMNAN